MAAAARSPVVIDRVTPQVSGGPFAVKHVIGRPLTVEALSIEVGEVLSSPRYREAAMRAAASIAEVADPVRVCHEALRPGR